MSNEENNVKSEGGQAGGDHIVLRGACMACGVCVRRVGVPAAPAALARWPPSCVDVCGPIGPSISR
jgi:hypothetical protein